MQTPDWLHAVLEPLVSLARADTELAMLQDALTYLVQQAGARQYLQAVEVTVVHPTNPDKVQPRPLRRPRASCSMRPWMSA